MRYEFTGDCDKNQATREFCDVLELVLKPLPLIDLEIKVQVNGDLLPTTTASIYVTKNGEMAYLGFLVNEGRGKLNFGYVVRFIPDRKDKRRETYQAELSLAETNSIERIQGMIKRGLKVCRQEIDHNAATRHTRYLRKFSDKMQKKWKNR